MTPDQRVQRLTALLCEERGITDPGEVIPGTAMTVACALARTAREILISPYFESTRALARLMVEEALADAREMLAAPRYEGARTLARLMAEERPASSRSSRQKDHADDVCQIGR